MNGLQASFAVDGSCVLADDVCERQVVWTSVESWAASWLAERLAREHGDACTFIDTAGDDAVAGVVDALVVLALAADGDRTVLGVIGAGPLEHLLSHSGNGVRVLAEVDRAARQHEAFRTALGSVWLGADVPIAVRVRLAQLGATLLESS